VDTGKTDWEVELVSSDSKFFVQETIPVSKRICTTRLFIVLDFKILRPKKYLASRRITLDREAKLIIQNCANLGDLNNLLISFLTKIFFLLKNEFG